MFVQKKIEIRIIYTTLVTIRVESTYICSPSRGFVSIWVNSANGSLMILDEFTKIQPIFISPECCHSSGSILFTTNSPVISKRSKASKNMMLEPLNSFKGSLFTHSSILNEKHRFLLLIYTSNCICTITYTIYANFPYPVP